MAPPELGFLFPAFDDRRANIYNALFYSRKADELHQEFIDAVFHTEPPMSAAEQKETFQSALADALEDAFNVEVAQAVHERLTDRIIQHKESRDPEPLAVTAGAADVLTGKVIVDATGKSVAGSMPNNGRLQLTIDGLTATSVAIPVGHSSDGSVVSLTSDIEDALAAI